MTSCSAGSREGGRAQRGGLASPVLRFISVHTVPLGGEFRTWTSALWGSTGAEEVVGMYVVTSF